MRKALVLVCTVLLFATTAFAANVGRGTAVVTPHTAARLLIPLSGSIASRFNTKGSWAFRQPRAIPIPTKWDARAILIPTRWKVKVMPVVGKPRTDERR